MASLLAKFRIDYSDLTLIPEITKKPEDSSISYFDRLIADFTVPENPDDPDSGEF
jgi:solute carrier family 12 (sodium/potassium/chloride transporter), member 2